MAPNNVADAVRAGADFIAAGSSVFDSHRNRRPEHYVAAVVNEATLSWVLMHHSVAGPAEQGRVHCFGETRFMKLRQNGPILLAAGLIAAQGHGFGGTSRRHPIVTTI